MKKFLLLILLVILNSSITFAIKTNITLFVPSMHCESCYIIVKKSLEKLDGIHKIYLSQEDKKVKIVFDDQKVTVDQLIKATTDAGHPSFVVEK